MTDQDDYIHAFSHFLRSGDDAALSAFLPGEQNTAFLSIYRNGFYKACLSALKANFTCVTQILGEVEFNQIATSYINLYPPVQATLVAYGTDESISNDIEKQAISFPSFLKHIADQVEDQVLHDIALLDQAWIKTLNKNNYHVINLAQVQAMLEQGQDLSIIPFKLIDSVSLINIEFDVFSQWQQLKFQGGSDNKHAQVKAGFILFWQSEGEVQAKLLSAIECLFYQPFLASGSIADAFDTVAQQDDEFDISALFADLLNASLLKLGE